VLAAGVARVELAEVAGAAVLEVLLVEAIGVLHDGVVLVEDTVGAFEEVGLETVLAEAVIVGAGGAAGTELVVVELLLEAAVGLEEVAVLLEDALVGLGGVTGDG